MESQDTACLPTPHPCTKKACVQKACREDACMQQACIENACMLQACRIEDIIQSWRRLRGERAVPCVRDDALSATMMLAPDRDNVFRVMVAGALAQRWSGLAFGAAFVSILAQEHRRQMTRRLADAARRQTPIRCRAACGVLLGRRAPRFSFRFLLFALPVVPAPSPRSSRSLVSALH